MTMVFQDDKVKYNDIRSYGEYRIGDMELGVMESWGDEIQNHCSNPPVPQFNNSPLGPKRGNNL